MDEESRRLEREIHRLHKFGLFILGAVTMAAALAVVWAIANSIQIV